MRYRLLASVEGNIFTERTTAVEYDGLLIEFSIDESNRLSSIAISTKVPSQKVTNFASSMSPGKGQSVVTIKIGGDKELYAFLVTELQAIESQLAFNSRGALKRIRWDKPLREEIIPENDEERQLVAVTAVSHKREYPPVQARIQTTDLENLIGVIHRYDPLMVSIAFWRDGLNFFENFQYILAFYYFYFVLEDFYAGGHFRERAVLDEFKKSSEFTEITDKSLQAISQEKRHWVNLERCLLEENCEQNAYGLQKLIFRIRGNLHHYYSRSSKTRGTPFNQSEYETIALITMHMATAAIGSKYVSLNRKASSQDEDKISA